MTGLPIAKTVKEMERDPRTGKFKINCKAYLIGRGPHSLADKIKDAEETNVNSVSRLVGNNPIAMSKYIPTWKNTSLILEEHQSHSISSSTNPTSNLSCGGNHLHPRISISTGTSANLANEVSLITKKRYQ